MLRSCGRLYTITFLNTYSYHVIVMSVMSLRVYTYNSIELILQFAYGLHAKGWRTNHIRNKTKLQCLIYSKEVLQSHVTQHSH